jgi:putative SOS response-associated peptidase YedK
MIFCDCRYGRGSIRTSSVLRLRRLLNNARKDSLQNFWREQFGTHHAIMVISGFFENVDRHRLERRELAPGETAQNAVIHFTPRPAGDMLVPCLWSHWADESEELHSMALITDNPPAEIAAVGHDRCPIQLSLDTALAWLDPRAATQEQLQQLLDQRVRPYYEHRLADAA